MTTEKRTPLATTHVEVFGDEQDDSFTTRPVVSVTSSFLYAVYVVGLSGFLLFLNALFAISVFAALPKPASEDTTARVGQLFFFIVPLLLLILEWNLLDRVHRLFRSDD